MDPLSGGSETGAVEVSRHGSCQRFAEGPAVAVAEADGSGILKDYRAIGMNAGPLVNSIGIVIEEDDGAAAQASTGIEQGSGPLRSEVANRQAEDGWIELGIIDPVQSIEQRNGDALPGEEVTIGGNLEGVDAGQDILQGHLMRS